MCAFTYGRAPQPVDAASSSVSTAQVGNSPLLKRRIDSRRIGKRMVLNARLGFKSARSNRGQAYSAARFITSASVRKEQRQRRLLAIACIAGNVRRRRGV